jgi:hypothetical protein
VFPRLLAHILLWTTTNNSYHYLNYSHITVQPYCRPGMYNALGHSLEHCPRFLTAVYGPYLSSIVAGLPLSTAIRYRLGWAVTSRQLPLKYRKLYYGRSIFINYLVSSSPTPKCKRNCLSILVPWIEIYVLRTRSPLMYYISHSFDFACVQRTSRLR